MAARPTVVILDTANVPANVKTLLDAIKRCEGVDSLYVTQTNMVAELLNDEKYNFKAVFVTHGHGQNDNIGRDAMRMIRGAIGTDKMLIVGVMSVRNDAEEKRLLKEDGAMRFIAVPIIFDEVKAVIDEVK